MYARKNWVNFNKYTFLFASQNLDSMNFCGNFHWSLRSHYRTKIEIQRKNVIFLKAYKQVAHTETTRYYSNRFNNTVYLKSKVFSTLQERRGRFRKLQFRSLYAHSIMQKKIPSLHRNLTRKTSQSEQDNATFFQLVISETSVIHVLAHR